MPICYEIEIEIERGPDDPKPGPGRFKTTIKTPDSVSSERLEELIGQFLVKMRRGILDSKNKDIIGELRDYTILGVIDC